MYSEEESLTAALKGQQFLVITLASSAPPEPHIKLVRLQSRPVSYKSYPMPNDYGGDFTNEDTVKDDILTQINVAKLQEIQNLGGSYIGMTCDMWYE